LVTARLAVPPGESETA
jgi:hypothetical protein